VTPTDVAAGSLPSSQFLTDILNGSLPAVTFYKPHGTQYDTTSILRLVTRRWHLPVLPGIVRRDVSLLKNGYPPMGDLTNALDFQDLQH
jgi:phospholipase C